MGNNEAGIPSKSEKESSPAQEHTNIHPYPDWAAIQAYYGPGVTLAPPYFNSTVTSDHAPHPYMWAAPQPLMPPYGVPYAAIYSHGGVYAHPAVPVGSHSHGHGIQTSPVVGEALVATPLSIETPAKSSGNKDRGLMKKLKGYNGFAVSMGNGNAESSAGGSVCGLSQSAECGTEGSSDGSDGNTTGAYKTRRERVCGGTPSVGKDGKVDTQASLERGGEANPASRMAPGVTLAPANVAGKSVGTLLTPSMTMALELSGSPNAKRKTAACVPPTAGVVLPPETWVQDERELKRQRRKQSNRESARRSRLRKQAESEELAVQVESLNVENMALRSEINQITENAEKLRLENTALTEKLKNVQLGQAGEMVSDKNEAEAAPPISTENYLSRVKNLDYVGRNVQRESVNLENSNSGTKLHQLLESSPRADAVAAG